MSLPLLDRLRPAPGPISGRWAFGIGDTLAGLVNGPGVLDDALRLLNRFGGLAVSAEEVEFDGDAVPWSEVDAVELHRLIGYLASGALDKQVNRLPLPWFPFRNAALGVVSQAVLTAAAAVAGGPLRAVDVRIPAEVRYRGVLRHRTLTPGVLAALVLADPAVRESLIATAKAHGVRVEPADDDVLDDAERRAAWLRDLWSRSRG
jgi:hypothetical protein